MGTSRNLNLIFGGDKVHRLGTLLGLSPAALLRTDNLAQLRLTLSLPCLLRPVLTLLILHITTVAVPFLGPRDALYISLLEDAKASHDNLRGYSFRT